MRTGKCCTAGLMVRWDGRHWQSQEIVSPIIKWAIVVISILLTSTAYGDSVIDMKMSDATHIASLIKKGDVILEVCRGCGGQDWSIDGKKKHVSGSLNAMVVVDVEVSEGQRNLSHNVIVTADPFFMTSQFEGITESEVNKEITAKGTCIFPLVKDYGLHCFDRGEGDDNYHRCKYQVALNYTYLKINGSWRNAVQSTGGESGMPEADTAILDSKSGQSIEKCHKEYKERAKGIKLE